MLARRMIAALAVLSGGLLALGGNTQGAAAATQPTLNGQVFDIADPAKGGRGGEIYLNNCAACHDEGVGRAPQRRMFVYMSPQSIFHALDDGAMKLQAAGLTKDDKVAVAEFLSRQKISDAAQASEPPLCKGKAAQFDYAEPPVFEGWGFQRTNTRSIPNAVAGIDKAKAARLKLKWAVAFPNALSVRSEPALAGGALYIGSHNGGVYAIDRASGCARWTFHAGAEVRTGIAISPFRAGDRSARPLLYFGDFIGNVYAVNAVTGQLVWREKADEHPNSTITGAPSLHDGTLYVPVSSMEGLLPADPAYECCKFRGSVVAYDGATGAQKWKTYTTDEPRLLGTNAKGAKHYGPAGATVWNSPTIDAKRGQLYIGTGGNSTSPATGTSDSIIAIDLKSGAVKWVYQGTAGDASNIACLGADKTNCPAENGPDYDFGAGSMLVTLADGRQLVLGGQKSGAVHAVDPDTGRLVWKAHPGRGGILGGVHFGMATNSTAVFVPIHDALTLMHDGGTYKEPATPGVYALNLATGKTIWSALPDPASCANVKPCYDGYSQAITATDDLVVAGSTNGWLRIFDAQSGQLLWQDDAKAKVKTVNGGTSAGGSFGGGAGPVLYHGTLYASAGYSLAGSIPGNVLLAFEAK